MNIRWFKIRSYHAVRFLARGGAPRAYCGKWGLASDIVDDLPPGKSCESCLRIVARLADQ